MVGQTQRPWIRQNPTSCLTQCQTEKKSFRQLRVTLRNIYKKQHGARPCVEKMQLIFFVPPNEELEGTLHPQKFGCTPKNEGKRVHVPPDEKTCGHAAYTGSSHTFSVNGQLIKIYVFPESFIKMWNFIKGVNPPIL